MKYYENNKYVFKGTNARYSGRANWGAEENIVLKSENARTMEG
jgi:hypothetical protein